MKSDWNWIHTIITIVLIWVSCGGVIFLDRIERKKSAKKELPFFCCNECRIMKAQIEIIIWEMRNINKKLNKQIKEDK